MILSSRILLMKHEDSLSFSSKTSIYQVFVDHRGIKLDIRKEPELVFPFKYFSNTFLEI